MASNNGNYTIKQIDNIINNLYHIGKIIETTNTSFNPNGILPGTWNKLPDNTFTATSGLTSVGNYGGDNNAIVVSHGHGVGCSNEGKHSHTVYNNAHSGGSSTGAGYGPAIYVGDDATSENGEHSHTITIASTGSSGTNKNMPRYLAVIKWIRVN